MLDLAILLIRNAESDQTHSVSLKAGTHLIGSDPSCDVVIDSPFIAPQQLQLTVSGGRVAIEPAGESVNTLLVGGQTISEPQTFPFPQTIDLGPISLHLDEASDATLSSDQNVGADSTNPSAGTNPAGTNDRYQLGPEIARGGMGVVIEAEETSLERTVAMKRILQATAAGMEGAQERFIREAKILGKLEHPNIVPVHELGEDSRGIPFYTMKKVEGHTLQDVINGLKSGNPSIVEEYPLSQLLSIYRKICDAVAFAHSRSIVHRDLKPDNIMIGEFGEVLVMDWGLAKHIGEEEEIGGAPVAWLQPSESGDSSPMLTLEGDVMGSPHYMSPEQAEGAIAEIDELSDVFSLGGILYTILTLAPPVEGLTVEELLEKIRSASITAPAKLNSRKSKNSRKLSESGGSSNSGDSKGALPKNPAKTEEALAEPEENQALPHCPGGRIPAALSAVAMKALAFDKSARYQTVTELVADIAAHQGGFATSVQNVGAFGQLQLWMLRNKGISITASALMAVILTLWGAFTINLKEKEQAARFAEQKAVANLAEAKLALADSSYRQRRLNEMSAHLEACPEEFRNQEWDYLAAQADNSIRTVSVDHGNFQTVASCRAIPGLFALADSEGGITLLDARTGQKLKRFVTGLRSSGQRLAFSPDGSALAQATGSKIILCGVPSGEILETWALGQDRIEPVTEISFSPDGKRLLLAARVDIAEIRAIPGGQILEQYSEGPLDHTASFSPTGKYIFAEQYGGKTVLLSSLNGSRTIFAQGDYHLNARFTDREDHFVVMSKTTGKVTLFRIADRKRMWSFETELLRGRVHLSTAPHETAIAFGHNAHGEAMGIAIGAKMGSERHVVQTSLQGMPGVSVESAYSAETGLLVALDQSHLGKVTGAKIWQVLSDQVHADWRVGLRPFNFAFSVRDRIWLPKWNQLQFALPGTPPLARDQEFHGNRQCMIESSRDGTRVATLDPELRFYQDRQGSFTSLVAEKKARHDGHRGQIDFSEDGRLLLAGFEGLCRIYDFETTELLHDFDLSSVAGKTTQLALVKSDRRFVTVRERIPETGLEHRLTLWNLDGERLKSVLYPVAVRSLDAAPDGATFALGCEDGRIRIHDSDTLEVIETIRAHDAAITALEYHPTKPILATGSEDLRVKLWDLTTLKSIKEFIGPLTAVKFLHFNPAGSLLAAGSTSGDDSKNQTVRVWNLSLDKKSTPKPFVWPK